MKNGRRDVLYALGTIAAGLYTWRNGRLHRLQGDSESLVPVTVSGNAASGSVLTANLAPGRFGTTGQWYQTLAVAPYTKAPIANATGLTYTTTSADAGYVPGFVLTGVPYLALGTLVPVPAPVITTAPVLAEAYVGSPVTWSAGVASGAVSSAYSLITASGAEVGNSSGGYTPTTAGGQLAVVFKAVGPDGQTVSVMSNTVVFASANAEPYMFSSARQTTSSWGIITTPTGATPTGQGNLLHEISEKAQPLLPYRQVAPRMCLHAYHLNQSLEESASLNPIHIDGVGYRINGVMYPVKYNGSASFDVPAGGSIWTDADDSIIVPADASWSSVICHSVDNTSVTCTRPAGYELIRQLDPAIYGKAVDGRSGSNTVAFTLASVPGAIDNPGLFPVFGPLFIVSKWWTAAGKPPVLLGLGDSRMQGQEDGFFNPYPTVGVSGWFSRGCMSSVGSRIANANMAVKGLNYQDVYGSKNGVPNFAKRQASLAAMNFPYTHIVSAHWTNQPSPDACIEQWNPYADYIFNNLGQKPIIQTTAHARNEFIDLLDGTLEWSTVSNQKFRLNWPLFSNWVRAFGQTQPVTLGYPGGAPKATRPMRSLELGGILESAKDSTRWKTPGFTSTLAIDRTSATNSAAAITLTSSPRLGAMLFMRNRAGTIHGVATVRSVAASGSNFVCTTWSGSGNPNGLVEAGTTVTEVYSRDGIHESEAGAIDLSAALIMAKTDGVTFLNAETFSETLWDAGAEKVVANRMISYDLRFASPAF